MKNSLTIIFLLVLNFAQGQRYFQHRFNFTNQTFRNERFNSGITTINNFGAGNPYYHVGIGTSYNNSALLTPDNKSDRLRFTRMNALGNAVLSNLGYHFFRDGKELHSSGNSIAEIKDSTGTGGYVAVGAVTSNNITGGVADGGSDILFTRLTATGAVKWARRIDLAKGKEIAWYIKKSNVMADGKATWLICGESKQSDTYTDCFVARVDTNGIIIWCRRYNFDQGGAPFNSAHCVAKQLCEDANGYIYVVGTLQDSPAAANGIDGLAFKLNQNGAVQWANNYHNATDDEFQAVRLAPDGHLIVGGFTNEGGMFNMQVTKLSAGAGAILFQNILQARIGNAVFPSRCYDILVVRGQGYYLAGVLIQNGILREMLYQAGAGGTPTRWNSYNRMVFPVGFGIDNIPGENCAGIAYFSSLKNPANQFSDGHIMKTDFFTRTCNFPEPKHPAHLESHLFKFQRAHARRDTTSGSSLRSSHFNYANWQICWAGCVNPVPVAEKPAEGPSLTAQAISAKMRIAPNPVHNTLHIELQSLNAGEYQIELLDMKGRLIQKRTNIFNQGSLNTHLDMSSVPHGVYLLTVKQGILFLQQKVVKE